MSSITPLHPPAEPMFPNYDPAVEQERVRLALCGLRDMMESAPSIMSFDPQAIGALVGLVADALPQWPEADEN